MHKITCLFASIIAVSCAQESPDRSFEQLKSAACSSDSAGFFSRFDWNSIQSNMMSKAGKGNALSMAIGRRVLVDLKEQIEDDLKLGTASRWCQATKVDSAPELETVFFSINGGETLCGKFTLSGGKYVLTSISRD